MVNVKYTIRDFELFDVNPEFTSDLERVTEKLYNASVFFPDFNGYEEGITLMHGVDKTDGVHPESPWMKARFRFNGETRIDSLQGVLLTTSSGDQTYVQLADELPEIAQNATALPYESKWIDRLSDAHIKGKTVSEMVIDRGKHYDTLTITLDDRTTMTSVYKLGTFIGFEIDETTGRGIKSTHYVLEDVDPSIYVPGFAECANERKDVVFNEGLMGGEAKPLLTGTKISYQEPDREHVELVDANRGDQYVIIFEAESLEKAQRVYSLFRDSFEDTSKAGSQMPFSVDALAEHFEPNVSVNDIPLFAVDLTRDRKENSQFYGLTLTTLSTGCFNTQNDLRDYLQGSVISMKPKAEVDRIELI